MGKNYPLYNASYHKGFVDLNYENLLRALWFTNKCFIMWLRYLELFRMQINARLKFHCA